MDSRAGWRVARIIRMVQNKKPNKSIQLNGLLLFFWRMVHENPMRKKMKKERSAVCLDLCEYFEGKGVTLKQCR